MKNKSIKYILAALTLLPLATSCEKDLPTYNTQDAWLNFVYYDYNNEPIIKTEDLEDIEGITNNYYSFVMASITEDKELTEDTVWIEVSTMGFLSDQNRTVELEQIATEENDAVPGVHYIAFNDPQLLAKSYVPAGANSAFIPIVVLRDASLEEKDAVLRFTIKDNGFFKPGYQAMSVQTLYISGRLNQPSKWSAYYCDYYFGTYGQKKHELMIEWTGKNWDDDYLDEFFGGDPGYVDYMAHWFKVKLEEENQKRVDAGLGKYTEDDGTIIEFTYPY